MEPKQHEVGGNIEQAPANGAVGEFGLGPDRQNLSIENGAEKVPGVGAVQAEISQITMPALPTPVASNVTDDSTASDNSTPLTAGDDDLIEKEWVDKAKKIIAETRDDPYRREREISKLQVEYIRKRYGRTVGDAGD